MIHQPTNQPTGYPSVDKIDNVCKSRKVSQVIQKSIKTPNINIYEYLMRRPRFNSCNVVCRCHSKELTFAELKIESERYAKAFAGIGVCKGDIVPICSEPTVEAVITFFALNRLGAISTFLNNTANLEEIITYVKAYNSRVICISAKCAERLKDNALLKNSGIEKVVVISCENIKFGNEYTSIADLILEHKGKNIKLDVSGKKDLAHISYTSGTTGLPKSILLSNENIMAEMISLLKVTMMQFGPRGNLMQVVPFNYPYGFIISTLLPIFAGKTAALSPRLNMKNISEYLEMYRPCYINGIPSFYKALINDEKVKKMDLSFIRYPVTGGDTLDINAEKEINAFLQAHGSAGKISNGCGTGEGCGSLLNPASVVHKYVTGSCGRPIPGLSVKLVDDKTDRPVPLGESGRFCFAGTNVMQGYYNDRDATAKTFKYDSEGRKWVYTDTFMRMDKNRWMFMDGRERRFFITFDEMGSPYKVYCDYVQKVIVESIAEISDCAVVKKSDEERGDVPVAFVCIPNRECIYEEERTDFQQICQQKLQRCAVPVDFILIKELPLTVAGKVDYRILEKKAEEIN